jgi:starch phosphorylase
MPKDSAPEQLTAKEIVEAVRMHMASSLFTPWEFRTDHKMAVALALALRGYLTGIMHSTRKRYQDTQAKWTYFLSIEYLPGRLLGNTLVNLGAVDMVRQAMKDCGANLDVLLAHENDMSLGNGGLGRLASCYLDSLATLGYPAMGYGLRYHFGLFRQVIVNGYQVEAPDEWMHAGTPGQLPRYDQGHVVKLYGRVENRAGHGEPYNPAWMGEETVHSLPFDLPLAGYGGRTVNLLRLFDAKASHEFDMNIFNSGDYLRAVEAKMRTETISKVLYPREDVDHGRELRLVQEYFLVSSALYDILRRFKSLGLPLDRLPDKAAIQLNDTHPALAVAELMRLLVDEEGLAWGKALDITRATLSYTNHTLMPEALEVWPVELMERVLPRHLQIIFEINKGHLDMVARQYPGDADKLRRMSAIEETGGKRVRMGHLAVIGTHAVNGVSRLHSELVKSRLFPDFAQMWPERFQNKTNGVTPRLWLKKANPGLSALLDEAVGTGWPADLELVRGIEPLASDAAFQDRFMSVKRANKERLLARSNAAREAGISPEAIFDVQCKRIHEYKRQLLNCLGIIRQYLRIVEDRALPAFPRVCLFAGKAAPGYVEAKGIIKLIHCLANTINNDPNTRGLLKVVFLPDYKVSLAEVLIPASDVSEQISTAGTEASGTGNMKFALNGAVTIGTFDGANIEMAEEVGMENIHIFGLKAGDIEQMTLAGDYEPAAMAAADPELGRVVDALRDGRFCPGEPGLFDWVADKLTAPNERYFHLADFRSYANAQDRLAVDWQDRSRWARKAILNTARMGKFSSDRAIREYARDIWGVEPVL